MSLATPSPSTSGFQAGESRFAPEELEILGVIDSALASGSELLRWWQREEALDYANSQRYKQSFVANRPEDKSFGFFSTAPLASGPLAVNGNVQSMFYDEPKSKSPSGGKSAEWMKEQVREFVLHYFMRISDYREPQQVPPKDRLPAPPVLSVFSQCPTCDASRAGFGFVQKLFKKPDGQVGRFRTAEQDAIIDLRRLGRDFEWIVLRNPIFDFRFEFAPFGQHGPQLALPLAQSNFLVTSKDFIVDLERPEPGILGRYGFGYAFIRSPAPSPLAYGPGQLEPAFEQLLWDVHDDGRVSVRAIFVANQPTGVLSLSLDPITWSLELTGVVFSSPQVKAALAPFKRFYESLPGANIRVDPVFPAISLLNLFSLGQANRRFCVSREQVMREFLFLHFQQHYSTILGSLQTWRQVGDWLNEAEIPEFALDGRSA